MMANLNVGFSKITLTLTICGLLLTFVGILFIQSAMYAAPSKYEQDYYKRQMLWMMVSLLVFIFAAFLPMRVYEVLAYVFYGLVVVLLIVLLLKESGGRTARWFNFGFFNFQVSEVAKLAVIFVLARYLAYSRRPANSVIKLAAVILLVAVPMLLVLKQPDLGTSLVFLAIVIVILFWSGIPGPYMLLMISPAVSLIASSHWLSWVVFLLLLLVLLRFIKPGALFGTLTIGVNLLVGMIMPFVWNRLQDYQKNRILVFLDPGRDPLGAGYQIIQSKVAIGSGGLWGKGYMSGTQTNLAFIPERHTDFIFSVLGEEFGFWGGLIVLMTFLVIILLGIHIAFKCRNRFMSYVAIGAITVFTFQLVVNVGMTLGLMPVTGLPLPFVSYGGSSLILSWGLLGLLVNAENNWQEY